MHVKINLYKTIMYNLDKCFAGDLQRREERVEVQRVDALVLEKTHSSKFTPAIHGYCSVGILMDYTPDGTLFDYVKGARLAGGSTLPPVRNMEESSIGGVPGICTLSGFYTISTRHDRCLDDG